MLLLAAGQKIDRRFIKYVEYDVEPSVPDYVKHNYTKLNLKHTCRKFIRNPLLEKNPNINLFAKADQLRLPRSLASYLVHNFSLNGEICDYDCEFW